MKQVKKILSVLMAVCLLVGCLPMAAMAAEADGTPYYADAPAGGNYTISTATQLKALAETVNGGEGYPNTMFTLAQDIDLSSVCGENVGDGGTSWEPIGNDESHNSTPFIGTFDGAGHEITGLYLVEKGSEYQGLFGYVGRAGTVKNLGVTDAYLKGRSILCHIGGIAGGIFHATVENCYFNGTVFHTNTAYIGGIVGLSDVGVTKNCWSSGTVYGNRYVGGVVGELAGGIIENCYSTSDLSTYYGDAGGIVGEIVVGSTVKNCYSFGEVSARKDGASSMGGIVGNNSYSSVGAVTNCYYLNGKVSGGINGEDAAGEAEKLTAEEFQLITSFENWNFTDIWGMNETLKRPILRAIPEGTTITETPSCGCTDCDETKCACNADCTGNPCTCNGCPENSGSSQPENPGKNPGSGGNTGGDTDFDDDVEPDEPSPACPKDSTCPIAKFTDTSVTGWYHDAIHYVLENGLMSGTGDKTFEPDSTLTRAMLVQILYNLEDKPAAAGTGGFTDVSATAWYADAVAWAAANKVVAGNDNGTFAPESAITREQIAVIFRNYTEFKGQSVAVSGSLAGFTDGGKTSLWATDAMQWAVGAGLFSGKENGILDPVGKSTRAEAAVVLMKFLTA